MKVDTIMGIDPGKTGGIAIKFNGKYKVYKMPDSLTKIDDLLKHYNEVSDSVLVVIEMIRLHQTENFGKASRMMKLYGNYMELLALINMNHISYVEASPRSWQSFLGLNTKRIKAMKPHEKKRAYRDFAQAWWPEKLSIAVADSVCLMIYGERNLRYNSDFGQLSKGIQKLI